MKDQSEDFLPELSGARAVLDLAPMLGDGHWSELEIADYVGTLPDSVDKLFAQDKSLFDLSSLQSAIDDLALILGSNSYAEQAVLDFMLQSWADSLSSLTYLDKLKGQNAQ